MNVPGWMSEVGLDECVVTVMNEMLPQYVKMGGGVVRSQLGAPLGPYEFTVAASIMLLWLRQLPWWQRVAMVDVFRQVIRVPIVEGIASLFEGPSIEREKMEQAAYALWFSPYDVLNLMLLGGQMKSTFNPSLEDKVTVTFTRRKVV